MLDGWRATQVEVLHRTRPAARLELLDEQLYRDEINLAVEPEDADTAVAVVRIRDGADCRVQWRRLALTVGKGSARARVTDDKLLGQDCCEMTGACERAPGDWMVHLERLCADDDSHAALATLIDPRQPVVVDELSDEASHGSHRSRHKIARRDPTALCGPLYSVFECPEGFAGDGSVTCTSRYRGEHWDYSWKRKGPSAAVLTRIEGTIFN